MFKRFFILMAFFLFTVLQSFADIPEYVDTSQVMSYMDKAYEYQQAGRHDSAVFYYKKADNIYNKAEVWDQYVLTQNRIGSNLMRLSRLEEAKQFVERSLAISIEKLGAEHEYTAMNYNTLAVYYERSGKYKEALRYFERALQIRIKVLGDSHVNVAQTCSNISICYGEIGDYEKQFNYSKRALNILLRRPAEYTPYIALLYDNIGSYYSGIGDYEQMFTYYQKALKINRSFYGDKHPYIGNSYNNIATYYGRKGNYSKQQAYLQRAVNIWVEHLGEEHTHIATAYNNMGWSYNSEENYEKSAYYYEKALNIRIRNFGASHPDVAVSYNNIAYNYAAMKAYDNAWAYYQKALGIWKALVGEQHDEVAGIYNNMGHYCKESGRCDEVPYFKKALDIWISVLGETHPNIAGVHLNIGDHYIDKGALEKADGHYNEAFKILTGNQKNQSGTLVPLKQIRSEPLLLKVLDARGAAFYKKYRQESPESAEKQLWSLKQSLNNYLLAIDLIDSLRNSFNSELSVQQLTATSMPIYERAIRTLYELYSESEDPAYAEQAYTISERSKSFLLLQSLKESEAKQFAGIPDSLVQNEKRLKISIAFYNKQLVQAQQQGDTSRMTLYQNYLFGEKSRYEEFMKQLEQKYPRYYELKYGVHSLSVAAIRNSLPDEHTALLEYFVGDEQLFIWSIGQKHFQFVSPSVDSTFNKRISQFRNSISNYRFITKSPEQAYSNYVDNAWWLYQKLIPNDILKHWETIDQLIVVPDAWLHYIPFSALLTEKPEKTAQQYTELPYLFRNYTISYAYSANLMNSEGTTSENKGTATYLGVAPVYQSEAKTVSRQAEGELEKLLWAHEEVKQAGALFHGDTQLGRYAVEGHFKEAAGHYNILHLAMHSLIDDENPLYSRLIFTQSGDTLEDDKLHVYELYNMELPAHMVVLSACNTGSGKLVRGEGAMSLARAFAYAGCPSTVMSLWRAHDQSTADLMRTFFQQIVTGKDKHQALRNAKLNYLQQADAATAHPYFWANFVLSGDTSSISMQTGIGRYWFIAIGLLLLLFLVWCVFKRSYNSNKVEK